MKKWMKFLHRDSMIQEEVYDGPLIKLENLVKIYDTGAIKVLGLKKINLTIERLRKIHPDEHTRVSGPAYPGPLLPGRH